MMMMMMMMSSARDADISRESFQSSARHRFAAFANDDKSARRCDFLAIFQCLKSARRRLARVKDATRDATSAAPSVSPPRAVL
jgi:hypothetical protein